MSPRRRPRRRICACRPVLASAPGNDLPVKNERRALPCTKTGCRHGIWDAAQGVGRGSCGQEGANCSLWSDYGELNDGGIDFGGRRVKRIINVLSFWCSEPRPWQESGTHSRIGLESLVERVLLNAAMTPLTGDMSFTMPTSRCQNAENQLRMSVYSSIVQVLLLDSTSTSCFRSKYS